MTNDYGSRRLWGHNFRLVAGGLDEDDVATFVEGLLNELQASVERSNLGCRACGPGDNRKSVRGRRRA